MRSLGIHILFLLLLSHTSPAQDGARSILGEIGQKLEKKDTSGVWSKLTRAAAWLKNNNDLTGLCSAQIYKGTYLYLANDPGAAFKEYYEALGIAKKMNNDTLIGLASFSIGQKYYIMGDYALAMKNLGEALRIYEHRKQEDKAADIYRYFGVMHSSLGSVEKSIGYLDKAYAYYKRKGDKKIMGALLNNFGHVYMSIGDSAKARDYFYQSRAVREEINDVAGIGQVYTNLGSLAQKYGNYEEALRNYRKGYELRKQGNAPPSSIIESDIFIGKLYYTAGSMKDAAHYLEKGLDSAKALNHLELQRRALEVLKEVYAKTGDLKKAYSAQERFYFLKDSLYGLGKRESILKQSIAQDFEKRVYEDSLRNSEREKHALAVHEEKDKRQLLVTSVLVICSVAAGGIALLLFRQNREKRRANEIITAQRDQLSVKQAEITDSINYARQIQKAVLPNPALITETFVQCFGLYLPKDVVSGDFYWFAKQNGKAWIAAADCTGHGVPGAFMSMIGIDKLNQATLELGLEDPSKILSHVNRSVKLALRQDEQGSKSRDGMDIALCCFDLSNRRLEYAGANRPLLMIRNGTLVEHKATKASIAGWTSDQQVFASTTIDLGEGDAIYIYTDGYSDQFGGEKGKKLRTASFKKLLLSIQHLGMKEQEQYLLDFHHQWKGKLEQVDDILVIGIRI